MSNRGSIGPAPAASKLVGEFRDPSERASGPWLNSDNPRAVERDLGARRWRNPAERYPARGRAIAEAYADGGEVLGGVRGPTGGRADMLPVDVPAGSYVIPADVVGALGEGNTEAGMTKLEGYFGRSRKAAGGEVVPILISHGEFVVGPEGVAKVGGAEALDRFVTETRNAFAEHLRKLPGPNR